LEEIRKRFISYHCSIINSNIRDSQKHS